MLLAGIAELIGVGRSSSSTFLPVPLWFRLPGQTVAVVCIVGGLLALAVMITEVVPAALRGAAFSLTGFLAVARRRAVTAAIGVIADQFDYVVDGEDEGPPRQRASSSSPRS